MGNKLKKQILYVVLLVVLMPFCFAANSSIDTLINALDYSYSIEEGDGTAIFNVTQYSDYIYDSNSNGVSDTLAINLSVKGPFEDNLTFVIAFSNKNGPIINTTNQILESAESNVFVNFPTCLLFQNKLNYSVTVYDQNDSLIFRKFNIETNEYSNYETGTSILSYSDQNINNNLLRINLTINSTQAITTNLTVVLSYNNSRISKEEERVLSVGQQTVSVDFDNESMKKTHYNGNFTISSVVVGNKIFLPQRNTSVYNYETFATTSYIKSISEGRSDLDGNSLFEFLEINFTIEVKSADTYTISYDLYDEYNNFIANISTTEYLSTGTQNIQTLVNGSNIYKTRISGPYVLPFIKLQVGDNTKDVLFNAFTTSSVFYTDFERPPLADLKVTLNNSFNLSTNTTNVIIKIENRGKAPAFNVFLDIFDNKSYENNKSAAFLDVNELVMYELNITSSDNSSLITAIADFSNLVDESNETNNIAQNIQAAEQTVSLTIESLENISTTGTLSIFEFVIYNDGEAAVTDIQWKLNTGNGYIINSSQNISSLAAGKKARVYARYNYSEEGYYNVIANATGIQASAYKTLSFGSTNESYIDVNSLELLSQNSSLAVFGFNINNTAAQTLNDINWSIDTGNGVMSANSLISISPNKTIFVFARHNYTQKGLFTATASATDGTYEDSESLSIKVKDIEVSGLTLLNISNKNAIFEFVIGNNLVINLTNATWQFNTRDNQIINCSSGMILQPNKEAFIYVRHNFSQAGTFNVNATAINGTLRDSVNLIVVLE